VLLKTVEVQAGLPEKLTKQFSTFNIENQVHFVKISQNCFSLVIIIYNLRQASVRGNIGLLCKAK